MFDENEEDENFKKVVQICEKAIEIAHERIFKIDKKHPLTINELRDLMFIVRESHYLMVDPNEMIFGGAVRTVDEDGNEIEDDSEEDEDSNSDESNEKFDF